MARVCAEFRVTILVGTPTFLRAVGINRWVHPMCFKHLRFVLSGAEKLRPEIRDLFARKFKKEIYEGYGCTETAPVATYNSEDVLLDDYLTMDPRTNLNSVGMAIPGVGVKIIDPITDVELPQGEQGMILVGGCQIMKGYLKDPERTKSVILEINGHRWYKTGDKGYLDKDGFVIIVDRYSRFAKLGGEMISLGAVEAKINDSGVIAGMDFIIVAIPDEVKGEKIVLLFAGDKDADEVLREIRKSGIPPMMIPGEAFKVDVVPKLGTGKADFSTAKKLAIELSAAKTR
jgi:acyl-[acyl-carrier-protein]-phospholipid O-acyltransferase/long-chain-fatty-acid--[acyl-carrier-protein] ligase